MATAYGTTQSYDGGAAKVRVFVSAEITNTTNTTVTVTVTAGIQYTTSSPSFTDYHIAHQQISVSSPSSESLFERTNTWYKTANFVRTSSWTEFGEGITKSVTKTINRTASAQTYTFYGETWLSCENFYGTYGNVPSESNCAATVSLTIPALPTYTISYNSNGGSGTVSSQTKTYGTALTLRSNSYTRSGYSFYHWNTKNDNSGTTYNAGASYTANAAATLYAIWNPVISYNANGGSGAPSSQTKTYGTALTLSSTSPTRTNHVFKDWNTKSDGTGTSYNPGDSYTSNSTATLYAQWYAPYAITPNANGGTLASGCTALAKVYNETLTLWGSSLNPTRTGYTYLKWNTKQDGTGTDYLAGASYTANAAATMYAQWVANVYTVSFNSNGGIDAPAPISKIYDKSATLPQEAPTRIGHTFLGWSSSSSSTSPQWVSGGSYSENILANTTLYAVWRDDYVSPVITSINAYRCDSQGVEDDAGTYAMVEASWSIDTSVDEGVTNSAVVSGEAAPERGTSFPFTFDSGSTGQSGTAIALLSNIDPDTQYTVMVTVTDVRGASKATTRTALILRAFYIMDFGNQGQSVGIGRAASNLGLEVGYKTTFDDDVVMYQDLSVDGDISSSAEVSATDSNDVVHNLTDKADQSDVDTDLAGKVSKSGDTMTGDLVNTKPESPIFVAKDGADLSETDNGITANHFPGFRTYDALGRIVSSYESQIKTDGTASSYMYVRNYADNSSSHVGQKGLKIQLDKSGTGTWTVDEPASFRSAINAVNKSGDTVTGILSVKATNIDRDGANPSSNATGNNYLRLLDKDSEYIGSVYPQRLTTGEERVLLQAVNEDTSNTQVTNAIAVGVKTDGTQTYSVSNAANFRSAINAVNKSGDTMTGSLNVSGKHYYAKNTNVNRDATAPSSNTLGDSRYYFTDADNEIVGRVAVGRLTNGGMYMQISCWGEKTSDHTEIGNHITIYANGDGSQTYGVSSPAYFRSAIGLGTDLGWTVGKTSYAWYMKRGRFCIVSAGSWGNISAASGSYTNIFTLPSGYRPITKPSGSNANGTVYGMCNSNGSDIFTYYNITDAGVVRVGGGGSSSSYWSFMCVFPCA